VGEIDWADGTIEIIETAEHALVNKTARIVEEVELKKIGSDHVETIKDKLRRQQVEIERLEPTARSFEDPGRPNRSELAKPIAKKDRPRGGLRSPLTWILIAGRAAWLVRFRRKLPPIALPALQPNLRTLASQ